MTDLVVEYIAVTGKSKISKKAINVYIGRCYIDKRVTFHGFNLNELCEAYKKYIDKLGINECNISLKLYTEAIALF